jgi:hypothetical protein
MMLRTIPPKMDIKEDAREVIFTTISCMCDNKHIVKFKKNSEGDFKMSGGGSALSNWQFKNSVSDIEWAADEQDWTNVIAMMNMSTEVIQDAKSR